MSHKLTYLFLDWNLKKILIICGLIVGLLTVIILIILIWVFVSIDTGERYDGDLVGYGQKIGQQLEEYKKLHQFLPDTLAQARIQENVCLYLVFGTNKCTVFHYKVLNNKQDFTLAANASHGFVVTYNGIMSDKAKGTWSLLNLAEDSAKENSVRKNLPIYRVNKDFFATPSAWPVLEENKQTWLGI